MQHRHSGIFLEQMNLSKFIVSWGISGEFRPFKGSEDPDICVGDIYQCLLYEKLKLRKNENENSLKET